VFLVVIYPSVENLCAFRGRAVITCELAAKVVNAARKLLVELQLLRNIRAVIAGSSGRYVAILTIVDVDSSVLS
jgi:hypothetical protein